MNYQKVEFKLSAAKANQFPRDGVPQIAFAGKSNVGKSSVINRVLQRKNLAYVGSSPGKTIHINYFLVDNTAYLVDLPGYGYAKVAKREKHRWSELIEGYFQAERNVGLVFLLVDMRHPPTTLDLDMMDYLMKTEYPFVIVLTKSDKLSKRQREERLEALQQELPCENVTVIPVSSQTGEGIDTLREILDEIAADVEKE